MLAYSEYDLYRDGGLVPGRVGPPPTYSPEESACLKDRKWWAFLLSSIFTFLAGKPSYSVLLFMKSAVFCLHQTFLFLSFCFCRHFHCTNLPPYRVCTLRCHLRHQCSAGSTRSRSGQQTAAAGSGPGRARTRRWRRRRRRWWWCRWRCTDSFGITFSFIRNI